MYKRQVYIHIGFVHGAYVSSAVSSEYLEIWNKGKEEVIKEAFTNTYNLFPPIMLSGLEAVSYTHLDVYKRQLYDDLANCKRRILKRKRRPSNRKSKKNSPQIVGQLRIGDLKAS